MRGGDCSGDRSGPISHKLHSGCPFAMLAVVHGAVLQWTVGYQVSPTWISLPAPIRFTAGPALPFAWKARLVNPQLYVGAMGLGSTKGLAKVCKAFNLLHPIPHS